MSMSEASEQQGRKQAEDRSENSAGQAQPAAAGGPSRERRGAVDITAARSITEENREYEGVDEDVVEGDDEEQAASASGDINDTPGGVNSKESNVTTEESKKALEREQRKASYQRQKESGALLLKNLRKRLDLNNDRLGDSDPPTQYDSRSDVPEESLKLGPDIKRCRAAIDKQMELHSRLTSWNDAEFIDDLRDKSKSWPVCDEQAYVKKVDECLDTLHRKANPVSVMGWLRNVPQDPPGPSNDQAVDPPTLDEAELQADIPAINDEDGNQGNGPPDARPADGPIKEQPITLAQSIANSRKRKASQDLQEAQRRKDEGTRELLEPEKNVEKSKQRRKDLQNEKQLEQSKKAKQ